MALSINNLRLVCNSEAGVFYVQVTVLFNIHEVWLMPSNVKF